MYFLKGGVAFLCHPSLPVFLSRASIVHIQTSDLNSLADITSASRPTFCRIPDEPSTSLLSVADTVD